MTTKRFTLWFACENAVFDEYTHDAIADALLAVSKEVRKHGTRPNEANSIRDNNGNIIGSYKYGD
jgi:hypothetical protein